MTGIEPADSLPRACGSSCGCDSTAEGASSPTSITIDLAPSAAQEAQGPRDDGDVSRQLFQVQGLDCREEVDLLQATVGQLAGVQRLEFDLLQGELAVAYDHQQASLEGIQRAIRQAGLVGTPKATRSATPAMADASPVSWRERWRVWKWPLVIGGCIVLGLVSHGWLTGQWLVVWHAELAWRDLATWQSPLAIPLVSYFLSLVISGIVVLPKALRALRARRADMHVLMTVAAIGAIGLGQLLEAAMVLWLFTVSLALESSVIAHARRQITSLLACAPATALRWLSQESDWREVPVDELEPGDRLLIPAGQRHPVDGEVLEGDSTAEESMLTGEPMPVPKTQGDEVYAGSVNGNGALTVQATSRADESTLARIVRLVQHAQQERSQHEQRIEKFAAVYTPAMMLLATLVVLAPPLLWQTAWSQAIHHGLVLLVVACPCALVIATPVAMVAAIAAAARHGVLIKGARHLETLARVRQVAFDKTGTLTSGQLSVSQFTACSGEASDVVGVVMGLAQQNQHPVAYALLEWARDRNETGAARVRHFEQAPGRGVAGEVDGVRYGLGNRRFVESQLGAGSVRQAEATHAASAENRATLHTVATARVYLFREDQLCGWFDLADQLRSGTGEILQELRDLGCQHLTMLTGDREEAAAEIAQAMKIDEYAAELLPEDKLERIRQWQQAGRVVAMIGDGINDGPALAAADLSIAMGRPGTDLASETADVVMMNDSLRELPASIRHSRLAMRIVTENIVLALGIKLLVVGLAWLGSATLWMAVAADAGTALLVVFNALRLLRFR